MQQKLKRHKAYRPRIIIGTAIVIGTVLGLSILLSWTPSLQAQTRGIESSIGGSVIDELPRPVQGNPDKIHYFNPGVIRLGSTQFCGDGDVASYSAAHPQVEFVSPAASSTLPVSAVLGYWSVRAPGQVPKTKSQAIWIPLASLTGLQTGAGVSIDKTQMQLIGQGSSPEIMATVNAAVIGLQKSQAGTYLMPAPKAAGGLNGEKRFVYFAVNLCTTILSPTPFGKDIPLSYDIGLAFQKEVWDKVHSETSGSVNPDDVKFVSFPDGIKKPKNVKFKNYGAANESLVGDPFFELAVKVKDAGSPLDLKNLRDSFYAKERCSDISLLSGKNLGEFSWEPVPAQLACKMLDGDGSDPKLKELIDDYAASDPGADEDKFKKARDKIVKRLLQAAMIEQAQRLYTTLWEKDKPSDRCFDEGQLYLNKVLASLPINVTSTNMQNSYQMSHPEPGFAVGQAAPYEDSTVDANGDRAGDRKTIFGMGLATEPFVPLELQVGFVPPPNKVTKNNYLLNFNIRGVMCSGGVFYCFNP